MKKNISTVLKNTNFIKLWLAQFISIFVVSLLNFVLIVRIFETTHSSVAIAIFWIIYSLPTVFLGLFAGVLVDYWSKRRVLLLTNLFQAVAALLYLSLGTKIWPIYGVVFLYSLIDEFFRPAQEASLPTFVEKKNLPFANGLMLFSLQGAGIAGYTLSGPLMRLVPEHYIFLLGSVLLLLGAIAAALLPIDRQTNHHRPLGNGFMGFLDDLKNGYRLILHERKIWGSILLMMLSGAVTTLVVALAPAIAENIFGIDLRDVSLLMVPPATVGVVLASLMIDRLIRTLGRINLTRLGFLTLGFYFLGMPFLSAHLTTQLFFIAITSFLAGVVMVLINVFPKTSIQENTPSDSRGRVFGTLRTLISIASSVPMVLGAALADLLGLRPVLGFVGLIVLLLSFCLLRRNDVL
jgi:MFS family permease